jgi:hypothetical protein|eukprot:SAG25_NODE_1181_length_3670_cov_3.991319_3_plen_30_part_00
MTGIFDEEIIPWSLLKLSSLCDYYNSTSE